MRQIRQALDLHDQCRPELRTGRPRARRRQVDVGKMMSPGRAAGVDYPLAQTLTDEALESAAVPTAHAAQ